MIIVLFSHSLSIQKMCRPIAFLSRKRERKRTKDKCYSDGSQRPFHCSERTLYSIPTMLMTSIMIWHQSILNLSLEYESNFLINMRMTNLEMSSTQFSLFKSFHRGQQHWLNWTLSQSTLQILQFFYMESHCIMEGSTILSLLLQATHLELHLNLFCS